MDLVNTIPITLICVLKPERAKQKRQKGETIGLMEVAQF